MQASHSAVTCHLGITRTLGMLEPFNWWNDMNVCTLWCLPHCLKCQARKTPRRTVRWPIITMPVPEDPGIIVSVDYFGPLPFTRRGITYIPLFTDHFSRRADMFPVSARGGYSQYAGEPIHPLAGVPAHQTLGQRPSLPEQPFTR